MRTCKICKCDISNLPTQRKICLSDECKHESIREAYRSKKTNKICKKCNKSFIGTGKQVICEDCKLNAYKSNIKVDEYIHCKECDCIYKINKRCITADNSFAFKSHKIKGYCETCRNKKMRENFNDNSKRMKKHNPMFDENVKRMVGMTRKLKFETGMYDHIRKSVSEHMINKFKNGYTNTYTEENKRKLSEYMKLNNPMYNSDTREKVSSTIKSKILSGEITYAKGVEHHLYKGGRSFGMSVRSYLNEWVKLELKKSNYTCTLCGIKGSKLHVHHKFPLRDIISNVLSKYNICRKDLNPYDNIYNVIINEIIDFHYNNEIGQVVCPKCHNIIDKYYYNKK